jgi:DNA-binding NarL/FixJ family response regulator
MQILIADDHALFREGLRRVLAQLGEDVCVSEAGDYAQLQALLDAHPDADLAIVDLDMPGREHAVCLESLLAAHPTIPLVVLSASEHTADMQRVLDAGAMGYLAKSTPADVLLCALRLVLSGGIYVPPALVKSHLRGNGGTGLEALSARQRDVLERLALGHSNKEIGRQLGMSEATVKTHLTAIFRTLHVTNRTQAMRMVRERGWFRSADPPR